LNKNHRLIQHSSNIRVLTDLSYLYSVGVLVLESEHLDDPKNSIDAEGLNNLGQNLKL
jgi:hypothetical protein